MIKSATIKNFMAHTSLSIDNIPQINVIIGKNDTGKTGLLKLLYATVKALEIHSIKSKSKEVSFKEELADKLLNTFMPRKNGLGDLVQKGTKGRLEAELLLQNEVLGYQQAVQFGFGDRTEKSILDCTEPMERLPADKINAIFVPAKEVLTAFSDIRNIRDKFYGVGFDDTYLDLIRSLDLPATKKQVAQELNKVNKALEELFEGRIEQTGQSDQPFLFKKGKQKFTMPQTAEGIKKIGILTTLIANGQLGKNSILFMDEPETTLHPGAVRQLVEMLVGMSKAGVQIFLASHSYFVVKQLSICAKRDGISIACWNLERGKGEAITNSFKDLSDGVLPSNSIIDEAISMYDQELNMALNEGVAAD